MPIPKLIILLYTLNTQIVEQKDMTDELSVDGQKKNKDSQLADVDFEVLMEFQRQVIKKYGSGRVPWFLSAIGDLAKLKGVTPNNMSEE